MRPNIKLVTERAKSLGMHVDRVVTGASGELAAYFFSENRECYAAIECFDDGDIIALVHIRPHASESWPVESTQDAVDVTLHRIASLLRNDTVTA